MGYRVDNAIIMAAGLSSRFAPISYEKPKALMEVRGEILIERQIEQLQEKGIKQIIIVVGYKKEDFTYLREKYGVEIIENPEYKIRNNNSSIYAVKDYLKNSYICSADNYFLNNPFEREVEETYYSAVYAEGKTKEWCLQTDQDDWITGVTIGGENQWYMLGHTFWSNDFSGIFKKILEEIYMQEDTKGKLWESIYVEHLDKLKMKIRRYERDQIYEFDSLDELRQFDSKYINHSGSLIMQFLAKELRCSEGNITGMKPMKNDKQEVTGVAFEYKDIKYHFLYSEGLIEKVGENEHE